MIYAQNGVPIGPDWTASASFPTDGWWITPCNKLDAFVNGTDAVFQLLLEQGGWQADTSEEVLMRQGFNGRDPLPFFYAVRFKVWTNTLFPKAGTIDMAAYTV